MDVEKQYVRDVKHITNHVENVGLIYLTGSHLTGVADSKSDRDYYVFVLPKKREFLEHNQEKGNQTKLDGVDVKTYYISHLYGLIAKANPNVCEMFSRRPVYMSDACKEIGRFLYVHHDSLPNIDQERFIKAGIGMMRSSLNRMLKNTEYEGNGSFGKDFYNFYKAYEYSMAVARGESLDKYIFKTGNDLEQAIYRKAMERPEDLSGVETQSNDMISEVEQFLDAHFFTGDSELFLKRFVEYLPTYLEAEMAERMQVVGQ